MMAQDLDSMLPAVPDYAADWTPNDPWYDNQLHDNGGFGILTQYGGNSQKNYDAYVFMEEQYRRFKLMPPQEDMLEWCWNFAFYAIDQVDPYILFYGCTDVIKTSEPYYYQFAIRESEGERWEEVSGDSAEMYRYWPEGVQAFEALMMKPGLQEYFNCIYDYYDDHFSWVAQDSHPEAYTEELDLLHKYGPKTRDLAHLGIWAAIMWMISPEAKAWRYDFHPIFQIAYQHKACFLNDWSFYRPGLFKMMERPLKSCVHCGVKEHCIELVQDGRGKDAQYECMHCQSDGVPFPGKSCGTLQCTNVSCSNHPTNKDGGLVGSESVRMMDADKRYGPMRQLENGFKVRDTAGMIHLNQKMIDHYSKGIAGDMGKVLSALLSPPSE